MTTADFNEEVEREIARLRAEGERRAIEAAFSEDLEEQMEERDAIRE